MTTFEPHYLDLAGSPKQMGFQHGETLRSVIAELAAERLDIIRAVCPTSNDELIQRVAAEILEQTRRLLPAIYEESEATSEAAKLPHWLLLVGGAFSDVLDKVSKAVGSISPARECTIWPARGPDGDFRLVGTWDTHATGQAALIVVRRKPDNAASTLALSTAGWPMQQGITSNGLGFAIANMVAANHQSGTSYICALPAIAQARSALDAAERASALPLCSGRYYAFCDSSAQFMGIETDGRSFWRTNEPIAHTNHFVITHAKNVEGRPEFAITSEKRRQTATAYRALTPVSIDALFAALAFHDETSYSISQHGEGHNDRTCAAFVIEPSRGRLHFTAGPPAEAAIQTLEI